MKNFNQLCVWPGTVLETEDEKITFEQFEAWVSENFGGVRIKMVEEVKTLPNMNNGVPVPETGGRNDLFFYVHDEDILKFAIPRLQVGIRWWEDVLGNGQENIYPKEILNKYPRK